jgi:lipopolysaccharide/colanic/teichoic acid biosynthesis glycosyltransferase
MLLSPHGGVGMLWLFACTVLGGAFAVRSREHTGRELSFSVLEGTRQQRRHRLRRTRKLKVVPAGRQRTQGFAYTACKRLLDLGLGAVFIVASVPLLAAITLGIALTLGRPIFFSQQRVGRGGRLFRLHKFRTLEPRPLARSEVEWSAPAAHWFALLLRTTGLDELPQLLNVLRGEMSLVGPRPERPHFVKQFQKRFPDYAARHHLQAGITGWAQVHGFRGDTSIARRLEHDLFYLNHWSLGLDLRILLLTLGGFAANLCTAVRRTPRLERTDFA